MVQPLGEVFRGDASSQSGPGRPMHPLSRRPIFAMPLIIADRYAAAVNAVGRVEMFK
jgi:hypothetical protein